MKSTLGRRAMICKELGWSLDYVEHGISYAKLMMMLTDMPHYTDNEKNDTKNTEDNEDDIIKLMMSRGARIK